MKRALCAIVLAAGRARRFGADKLLQDFDGAPILAHALKAARAAPAARVIIVKRPGAELDRLCRAEAARDPRIEIIEIDSDALSQSLRAGLAAAQGGAFVFLGDMPLIPPGMAALLADRIGDALAAAPVFAGRPGHPVLLSARAAALAEGLGGDQGLGALLRARADEVVLVETQDEGVVRDIDTAADLQRLAER